MSWDTITNWISQFFDKKIVIIITTILSLLVAFFWVFSKTSIGRKALTKLITLYELGEKKINEIDERAKAVEELANEKIESLKSEYEKKTVALVSIVDYYVESLFDILEKVPNAKVQNELLVLRAGYDDKKEEISQWVDFTYQDFNEQVENIRQEVQEEKDVQIAALKGEIARLEELINTYIKPTEEGENAQENETENTDPIEEEV